MGDEKNNEDGITLTIRAREILPGDTVTGRVVAIADHTTSHANLYFSTGDKLLLNPGALVKLWRPREEE